MYVYFDQQISISTLRHALVVMGLCFLPHVTTSPWWLSVLACCAIFFRLAASYWSFRIPPWWLRTVLVFFVIFFLRMHYGAFFVSGFFINSLVTFFWLKLIELHSQRDLRVIILISFYVIFTALITHSNVLVFLYVIVAVLAALSLLLKIQTPRASFLGLGKKSITALLIALPISLLLFFLFPRITTPLWLMSLPTQGTTAFTDQMTPGSLTSIVPNNSVVMRIIFKDPKKATIRGYWKGLALSRFNGGSWKESPTKPIYLPLPLLESKENADYEILLEPHQKQWLFYLQKPSAGWPKLQFANSTGLMRLDRKKINQRFIYALSSTKPQVVTLNPLQKRQNLTLPEGVNPDLKQWARQTMANAKGDAGQLTTEIIQYIQQQPFWYTLTPQRIGQDKFQLDRFWFKTRQGYCEYYASAAAFIYRAAGVPARVILGYFGGEWNPIGNYLSIRQKNAHAWVEYWQEETGWVRFDPTAAIPIFRIDKSILETANSQAFETAWDTYRLNISWFKRMKITYDSFQFYLERWSLFYNRERQAELLSSLGLGPWNWALLLKICIGIVIGFLVLGWVWYYMQLHRKDPLYREYDQLKKELQRLNISITPPSTLLCQLKELVMLYPELSSQIKAFYNEYEQIRLQAPFSKVQANRETTRALFKSFRKQLAELKPI